jgi:hypothetical protein
MKKFKWLGFGRREIRGYVWPHTGAVVEDVSPEDAELLLRFPEQFEEIPSEEKQEGEVSLEASDDEKEES